MASWAPALTGQHSFFCCQMMPGTVFVQADSQHCPLWTEAESLIGLPERRIGKHVFFIFICYFFYFLLHFNVQNEDKKEELIYLWLEVRSKLRRYLDGIIAPLRITVLHVCVTFVACAGASVVHIWACHSKKQLLWFLNSGAFHQRVYIITSHDSICLYRWFTLNTFESNKQFNKWQML